MFGRSVPRRRRSLAVAWALVLVGVGLGWALAGPASAHTGLQASDPIAGSAVAGPVERVALTFTKPVETVAGGVELFDGDGSPVGVAAVDQPAPERLEVVPGAGLDDGAYGLRWSARAGDGHVIDGTLSFVVGPPVPASASSRADDATGPGAGGGTAADGTTAVAPAAPGALADALEGSAPSTTVARAVGWTARSLVYAGVLLAIGGIVYLLFVHEGTPDETRRIVYWVRRAAAVVVAATVLQALALIARTHQGAFSAIGPPENWAHTFGGNSGVGLGLAATGGVAILLGLRMSLESTIRRLPLDAGRPPEPGGGGDGHGLTGEETLGVVSEPLARAGGNVTTDRVLVRTRLTRLRLAHSRLALVGAGLVLASFLFLGHTTSEGPRVVTAAADVVHVGAGAVWSGGATLLAAALWRRRLRPDALPGTLLVARFARAASVSLVAVAVSGLTLGLIMLPDASALWTTSFGALLAAKLLVVACLVGLGAHSHFRSVPALEADPLDRDAAGRLRRVVTVEVVGFALVIGLTAALVASSPT